MPTPRAAGASLLIIGLIALIASLPARALAAAPPPYDPAQPATWKLSAKLARRSAARAELIKALAGPPREPGEAVSTRPQSEKQAEP